MIKKLLLSLLFLFSISISAQVGLIESFNAGLPAGWNVNGAGFAGTALQSCDGQSIRANVWTANGGTTISTPNFVGASNATDLDLSFDYKMVDWSAATAATAPGWGTFNVEYSTDGGATWILIETIDDSNHVTSNVCATLNYTIDAADLPDGSDFQFRIDLTWAGGDYYFYLDNVFALQSTSDVPDCDSVLTIPADGAADVSIETNLVWSAATGLANNYMLTVGTTPGGNDVLDGVSTGLTTNYDIPGLLEYETTYYVSIVPENDNGLADANTCQEFSFTTEDDPSQVVDCDTGPINSTYCYGNGEDVTFVYTSSDGSPLNFIINSGNIELFFDDIIIFDSDGSILFDLNEDIGGFGNYDLAGTTFQSTGDNISFQITSDGSVSCESSANYFPIDYSVSCATCVNPQADFELVTDCLNAPQFFIDVDVTDLGSAASLEISDSEGVSTITVTEVGVVQVGPFPNGTDVSVDVQSLDDVNCLVVSNVFNQEFCTLNEVDCSIPFTGSYCYPNNDDTTIEFVSEDGSLLDLNFTAGNIDGFDGITVFDSDGSILFDGDGDMTGLSFQSTGDSISFQVTSGGFNSCATGQQPELQYSVNCATCVNPQANYTLVNDCLNAPQFFVDVDVTDLGSATTLEITDNEGLNTETVTETGVVQVGPYPNGTQVNIVIQSLDDANCSIISPQFSQEFCTLTEITCDSPFNGTYCYGNNENTTLEFVSENGLPLNFTFNAGTVEAGFDDLIVFDTDGSILFDGDGNLAGLTFQSTGDTISFLIDSDGSVSCESGSQTEIDYTVTCATCINPQASYQVVGNCVDTDDPDFFIEVDIESLGDATSLLVTNNQGDAPEVLTDLGVLTYGPYALGTEVVFTIENQDDANCSLTSNALTLASCDCFGAEPFCAPEDNSPLVFPNVSDGTTAPTDLDYGCLFSQPNPVWFYLIVEESGDLEFQIVQSTQLDDDGFPDENNGLIDVDFLAWGPFEDSVDGCSNLVPETQVDCSYSAAPIEDFNIPNAQAGEVYVVLITNFNGASGFISLGQVNTGQPGSGSTNCEFIFTEYGCASDGVLLSSEIEDGNAYQWFILDDPDADPEDTSNYVPVENGEDQNYLAIESGSYFVLSQAQDNSFQEEFFTVRLSETPVLDMELEHNICEGETLTLDATPTNSDNYSSIAYQWFDEDGLVDGATSPQFTFNETGLHILEITTEELLGSTTFECVNVFEIDIQGADFEISLGEDQFFCDEVEPQTITASILGEVEEDANITYLWSTGEETATIDVTETGTYSVEVSVDGCVETAEVNYGFSTALETDFELAQNLCEGETLVLNATPVNNGDYANVSYQWLVQNNPIDGATEAELVITETGFYSVEITAEETVGDTSFECTTTFDIDVQGAEYQIDLGGDQTYCDEDEPQTIVANLVGTIEEDAQITYAWSTGEVTESIEVSETGTYNVEVSVDGCVETAEVSYTFNTSPQINLPMVVESCDLSTVILDATPQNVDATLTTFEWRLEGVLLQDEFMELLSADDYGFGTYELTAYSDDENCAFVQEIEVEPRFVSVSLTTDSFDNLFCPDEEVVIAADVTGIEGDDVSFTWLVNGVAQTGQNQAEFIHIIGSDASNTNQDVISVSVNVGGDCIADTVAVDLERYGLDNCIIPEGMSPDGINHTLDLRFLSDRSGIRSLEIFNRFGKSVFQQNNYTNEFTGQNQNGTRLVTGTYFYVIKFNEQDPVYGREHKGWIYLNREQQ